MKIEFTVSSEPSQSNRVKSLESILQCPVAEKLERRFSGEMPLEQKPWSVGLIVGPSGCGKSSVMRNVFGDPEQLSWNGKSILDDFPQSLTMEQITEACSSVGFNSIPSWMIPYSVLSTGEKFRAELARRIVGDEDIVVFDEFTSVVDRQVAKIGSHAVQKFVRKKGRKFVAVTCHSDVEEWLQPDWVFEPESMTFTWRLLRRRPSIDIKIRRVHNSLWSKFSRYHYMTSDLVNHSWCFGAFIGNEIVSFVSMIHNCHRAAKDTPAKTGSYRFHRMVTLPDWQGLGIGMRLLEVVAAAFSGHGKDVLMPSAHPSLNRQLDKSPLWLMTKKPGRFWQRCQGKSAGGRMNGMFRFVGRRSDYGFSEAFIASTRVSLGSINPSAPFHGTGQSNKTGSIK